MSRIIHGQSSEVKTVKLMTPQSRTPQAFSIKGFKGYHVEGTYTQKELEEHKEMARQEGRAEGAREAEARMVQPLNAALENVETILDELSHFRRELFKEAESDIVELVRTIAKRVLNRELQVKPELLNEIVAKAVELLERQRKVLIRVSPQDFQIFSSAKQNFLERFKGLDEVEVHVDSNLSQGQAFVKSKSVEVDVHMEKMVDHLLQQVTAVTSAATQVNEEKDQL